MTRRSLRTKTHGKLRLVRKRSPQSENDSNAACTHPSDTGTVADAALLLLTRLLSS